MVGRELAQDAGAEQESAAVADMAEHDAAAIDGQARERGCGLVQLTSDKRRSDAIRFYESLGFERSHEGLKLSL